MPWPFQTNPQLVELARQELKTPRRILITGATGFVGSRLAHVLCDAGHRVTISGRSRWRVSSPGHFVAADITSPEDVIRLCQSQQIVIHCAAATSPWGTLAYHRSVNVLGTRNIVAACIDQHVERLVHVSSTASFFQYRDRTVEDQTPWPVRFCNAYAQTKAEAESVVLHSMRAGLSAYIVRARAVFGPGDNALLPRLIAAASEGRLRQIGHGQNKCDLTYIDNLLAGLIAAASPDRPSGTCTITNQEPIKLWELLHRVLKETVPGYRSDRAIPYRLAYAAATWLEWKHRLLSLRGEPALTRYSVGLLAKEQIFHSEAACRDLNYRPIVSMDEGIQRSLEFLHQRSSRSASAAKEVQLQLFSTGYIVVDRRLADRSGAGGQIRFHATVALITHPDHGPILFDAGYTPEFFDATAHFPYCIYRWLTRVVTRPEWTADAWLMRQGIKPDELQLILLSHFHGDHIGALNAFPNAQVITLEKTWSDARNRKGIAALKRAILPRLLPDDLDQRLHTLSEMHSPGIGPFPKCHDLFHDGSIRLFELDGHATGQMGALLNVTGGKRVFLVADASWSRVEIQRGLRPTLAFRILAANYRSALRTRAHLHQLAREYPDMQFVCTHCPDQAREQQFDAALDNTSAHAL